MRGVGGVASRKDARCATLPAARICSSHLQSHAHALQIKASQEAESELLRLGVALKKVAALILEEPAFEPVFLRLELEYRRAKAASKNNIYSRAAALLYEASTPPATFDEDDGPSP